ncbi:MAG: DUF3325 family protein [Pseudomonadota bacterium]
MNAALLIAASFLVMTGCACLAVSQKRHTTKIVKASSSLAAPSDEARSRLKVLGWGLQALSFGLFSVRDHLGFAVLDWFMAAGAFSVTIALALAYKPQLFSILLRPLSRVDAT